MFFILKILKNSCCSRPTNWFTAYYWIYSWEKTPQSEKQWLAKLRYICRVKYSAAIILKWGSSTTNGMISKIDIKWKKINFQMLGLGS